VGQDGLFQRSRKEKALAGVTLSLRLRRNNRSQRSLTAALKPITDNLNLSQEQETFILGHSLRSLDNDVPAAELPDRLKALVEQLENGIPHRPTLVKLGLQQQWNG
jgi:hypothetical protein